jgi:hypothetical protein
MTYSDNLIHNTEMHKWVCDSVKTSIPAIITKNTGHIAYLSQLTYASVLDACNYIRLEYVDPEDDGSKFPQTADNHFPVDTE